MTRVGAGRQQQIELLDVDADVTSSARHVRWWWAAGSVAALVAGLLVVQGVIDARERAATARLSGLPGVVSPVPESVGIRWSPGSGSDDLFSAGIIADGAVIGLDHGSDGSQRLVAFDEGTGSRRWSVPLLDANPNAVPTPRGQPVGTCQRDGLDAVCLVTDAYVEYGIDPPELVPGDRSSIVVVDARTGDVVTSRAAPGVTSFAVLPGLVVTGRPTSAGGLVVVGADLRTGTVRWTVQQAPVPVSTRGTVFPTAGGVGVWMPPGKVTLLGQDGNVLAEADASIRYAREPATGVVIASSRDASGRRVSQDLRAGHAVTYPGARIPLSVDDGSVPGLVLTSDERVDAYDSDTGRLAWSLPRRGFGSALIMLGRVYLMTSDGVVAVDGSSGVEIWRAPVGDGANLRALFTDGHHVLASERRDSTTELAAYSLDDGHEDWHTTLPGRIDTMATMGHLLIGFDRGTPSVLG